MTDLERLKATWDNNLLKQGVAADYIDALVSALRVAREELDEYEDMVSDRDYAIGEAERELTEARESASKRITRYQDTLANIIKERDEAREEVARLKQTIATWHGPPTRNDNTTAGTEE